MEARWRGRTHRFLRDRHHRRFHVALSALPGLWSEELLGGRSDGPRCVSCGGIVGRASADVHLYDGQSASLVNRQWRASPKAIALDTASVPALDQPARRIRARPRAVVGVWRRPYGRGSGRRHSLEQRAAPRWARVIAPVGLFGAGAFESQRRATLSLSVRHFTLFWNAVAHW